MSVYRYQPVLFHHGIKGMRWGIRRDKTSGSSQRKTSKAYDDYKKAIRAFENAEHLSTDDKRRNSGMEKALQMEKEAKRNFTREDKKQVKADNKENRRLSKENVLKARYTPEEFAKREARIEKTKTYAKVGAAAAASVLAAYGAYKIHDRYFKKSIKVAQKIPYQEIVGYRSGTISTIHGPRTHMYPIFETRFREQVVDLPNPHRITFGVKNKRRLKK